MNEDRPKSSSSWRPRLSLRTGLFLMTIVGLAIVVALQWRDVGPLKAENRRLRGEVGYLNVENPAALHALNIERGDRYLWRWRMYVPQHGRFVLYTASREIPLDGIAPKNQSGGSIPLQPGEYLIDAELGNNQGRPNNGAL